jgi:hypothetical protein
MLAGVAAGPVEARSRYRESAVEIREVMSIFTC